MKRFYLFVAYIFLALACLSQISPDFPGSDLPEISDADKEALRKLPVLELPLHMRGKGLPTVVDNSTQPFMRDVFQQHMYCCGQAAGIAYNFTYEMDRERGLPADNTDNLYPTHFTWNWMNSGYGYYGVSFLHSFQVLKQVGCMNVTDYGGTLSYGGETRWISGYNAYHNGMGNRINNAYQIQVGTPEGLETFKNWIHNHLDNSPVGGVGSFYSQYMSATNTLPSGTPEAGKYVLTYFGGSANHAQTIVGYNDSIRWDYNGDGLYTNNIDINNDGEVNMKDWEIGGFKMVQSYGGVPGWGDQGYAYMMYKTVADNLGQGGIWNHSIFVLDVKENCEPQATMKVTLTHDMRERLKVVAGVSNNVNAVNPQYVIEYPIFNYQGGNQYMQGGWSPPENKTLEFGLDISPLLSEINLGQDVKFFLQVYEYDPSGSGSGEINSFSVIDYTNTMVEHTCPQTNVPIDNHDLTSLSLTATFDFNRINITNSILPAATVGQAYSVQLFADGGTEPYTFGLLKQYDEIISSETFPNITANQLSPNNGSNGFVTQALDFSFPYYDSTYSSVTVHVDGYLMFDEQLYPYPYFIDDMNLFKITRHIAPFMCSGMRLYGVEGDGIWYEGDANQATFRWKASIDGFNSSTDINVAVRLFPDGKIEFLYGDIVIGDDVLWVPGLSDGNSYDLQFSDFYSDALPSNGSKYEYERYTYPEGLSISEDGLISGTVTQPVNGEFMTFKVTDNNFVYDTKTLIFSTTGVMIMDSISSGGDGVIEYGEMANLSVELTNLESDVITDASMSISVDDPYIDIIDDNEYIGTMQVGVPVMLENAFSFQVDPNVPNEHMFEIETTIQGSTKQLWENTLQYVAYAPAIELMEAFINDGQNGRLDPGETADMLLHIKNNGGARASMMECILLSQDPMITINIDNQYVAALEIDSSALITFNVTVDPTTPIGHLTTFELDIDANMGFETNIMFDQRIGLTLEDFETGDFQLFSWGFEGSRDWVIDQFVPYEGDYSARSGNISHQQESSMILDVEILQAGDISFYRKVSCEDDANDNYDFLAFYIDNVEKARWDSIKDWEEFVFPLSEGYHRLRWTYSKDSTVSVGLDAAFIDYISFPGCLDLNPQLSFTPLEWDKIMRPEEQDTDTLFISNSNPGMLEYNIVIAEVTDNGSGLRSIEGSYLECEQSTFSTGQNNTWDFTLFNASNDDEWIRNLHIDLPIGVNAQSTTNFSGGSGGDMEFNGVLGNGAALNWWGEDASGWGVVHGGEYAFGSVTAFVNPSFTGDMDLEYSIAGDGYGAEPHILEGVIKLSNMGGSISWLTCDVYSGNVNGQGEQEVMLNFNTEGLEDGDYYCELIISDNFQHETIIPVHLLVDTYLGDVMDIGESSGLEIFPNPFINELNINLTLEKPGNVNIKITDLLGRTVGVIADNIRMDAGMNNFRWNADGQQLENGLLLLIVEADGNRYVRKLIYKD